MSPLFAWGTWCPIPGALSSQAVSPIARTWCRVARVPPRIGPATGVQARRPLLLRPTEVHVSTTLRRGERIERPSVPEGRFDLQPPPELQPHEGIGGALMMALPMLASVGSIVFVASSGAGARGFIAAGMFLVATLGFVAVNVERQLKQRKTKVVGARREYLQYLSTVRGNVRRVAEEQRDGLVWLHPSPSVLATFAEEGSRVWERGAEDPHRLHVRYGTSTQPLAVELVPPETAPIDQVDPVCASALHRLLAVHRAQPSLPAAIDLGAFSRIELIGPEGYVRGLARSMICEATAFHAPDQLVVAVLTDGDAARHWDWVKWLPQAQSGRENDAVGPSRMVSGSIDDLAAMLPRELIDRPRFGADQPVEGPHVLLVVDGVELPPGNHLVPDEGVHGVTVLELPERWGELDDPTRLRLQFEDRGDSAAVTAWRRHEEPVRASADHLDLPSAEAFARRLAPLGAVEGPVREDAMAGTPDLTDLLGLGDVRNLNVADAWRERPARDQLRVPIGIGANGAPIYLDIKESAQQGMGPHGLVIGATGSGKSELLRTLVLGLALTHSSETLNMVLVDFKGGATFAGLSDLPHVSAVITNLEDELPLVDRMQDALSGEMVRRQELLRRAGNYASARDYEKARAAGEDLEPMPSLFIVVDEFSEMLSAKPDFIDLFVAIGRLGRSLGLHLLLASQRLEEGRLRGLESHLSYRIGLRTFSAAESRAVLGSPDAYELPSVPGLGYLKADQSSMTRFKAAYVSGPPPRRAAAAMADGAQARSILPFTTTHVLAPLDDEPAEAEAEMPVAPAAESTASVLDIAVDTMVGQGPQAHQVWLPPLDVPDTLDVLMPDLAETDDAGLLSSRWSVYGGLRVPMGTLDRPREQRREVLTVDLSGAGGHLAVVGGPRSGKSTVLRTVVASIALTSSPRDSQIYVLDFGGGTFSAMTDLPHVSGVGTRAEPDVVRRIFAEVNGIADRREAYLRQQGIDSVETYRARRREGSVDDGYGDVYLVIDGWSTLRADFDSLEMEMQTLAQRGLTYGIHVLAGASRWGDFRAAMRDLFGTRLELRLGDPTDSEIDRKVAQLVPAERPGRGLVPSKLHFLSALPRLDGKADGATVGPAVDDLVARVKASWPGQGGPKLRLLPSRIELDRVRELAGQPDDPRVLLGIDERDLAPVGLDVEAEPHLLVYGDGRSGKSSLLRAYAREVMRSRTPAQAQIIVVDYRRAMLGELPDEFQMEYVSSAAQIEAVIGGLAEVLKSRLPGPDVTPDQLRSRSWWSGPDAYVLVDDYDLVSPQNASPLAPLVPYLAQGRDVGLHMVVARRSGGASRASFDPVLQTLRELAQPGILLSGSPDEGPLIGNARPRPAQAGRAQLITRDRGVEIIQTAWAPPTT
ncbi:type VII secretion protein EccCa [Aeromicrobium sp. SMF47]|nr:type VII secretion protein EccCa [Aeromicrobium yanjiei]MRK00342.1 type VII secretion protein EccCa [Aeromicrobium sp. S22]